MGGMYWTAMIPGCTCIDMIRCGCGVLVGYSYFALNMTIDMFF